MPGFGGLIIAVVAMPNRHHYCYPKNPCNAAALSKHLLAGKLVPWSISEGFVLCHPPEFAFSPRTNSRSSANTLVIAANDNIVLCDPATLDSRLELRKSDAFSQIGFTGDGRILFWSDLQSKVKFMRRIMTDPPACTESAVDVLSFRDNPASALQNAADVIGGLGFRGQKYHDLLEGVVRTKKIAPSARLAALEALVDVSANRSADFSIVDQLCLDPDPTLRVGAIRLIPRIGAGADNRAATDKLLRTLIRESEHDISWEAYDAARSLYGEHDDRFARDIVLRFCHEPWGVAQQREHDLANCISQLCTYTATIPGRGRWVPQLKTCIICGRTDALIETAYAQLEGLGTEAEGVELWLADRLNDSQWGTRAANALLAIGPHEERIRKRLVDALPANITLDFDRIRQIGRLGPIAAPLAGKLAIEEADGPLTSALKTLALRRIADADDLSVLKQSLSTTGNDAQFLRMEAVDEFGRLGSSARPALPAILAYFNQCNELLSRRDAVIALCRIGDDNAARLNVLLTNAGPILKSCDKVIYIQPAMELAQVDRATWSKGCAHWGMN